MEFGMVRTLAVGFDEALARIPDALKAEGFGVLTEIDVQATLKKKLDVGFRRYRILGACNPPFAHRALETRLDAGLMLPCNLAVWEGDDGHAVVAAVDPTRMVAGAPEPALQELAGQVRDKLAKVLDSLAGAA